MQYNHHITGQVIGSLRVQKDWTQQTLADKAGIARSHLTMIESGAKSASVETLWRIAHALGLPLSKLFKTIEINHHHTK